MKILHISIPKNGGTYIANNLAINFKSNEQYIVDENRVHLFEFLDKKDEVVANYDFVAGHIPFRLTSTLADRFDLIVSSYRDPWTRCWSFFRYVTANQPEYVELKPTSQEDAPEKFLRFIDQYFLANRFSRNSQCGYLGEKNLPDSALANIDAHNIQVLSNESIEEGLRDLAKKYGLKLLAQAPKNETPLDGIRIRQGEYEEIDRKIHQWFDGDFELIKRINGRRAQQNK